MEETVNQEVTENKEQETARDPKEKTFTQAEVNAMIEGRLARAGESARAEIQKLTEAADKLQKELNGLKEADRIRDVRDQVAAETGVPASLLTGDDEESCKAQADAIKAYATPKYPAVQDGGEATVKESGTTREQFASWFEAQQK